MMAFFLNRLLDWLGALISCLIEVVIRGLFVSFPTTIVKFSQMLPAGVIIIVAFPHKIKKVPFHYRFAHGY